MTWNYPYSNVKVVVEQKIFPVGADLSEPLQFAVTASVKKQHEVDWTNGR